MHQLGLTKASTPAGLLVLSTILCLMGVLPAQAQNMAVDRSVLSGGGGTSTNAQFRLDGSIGQPDAGPKLAGGSYSLDGGFWSVAVAVQTPGAPLLSITRVGGGVMISWPAGTSGYVLEVTGSLRTPVAWVPVPGVMGNSHSTPAVPGVSYFRLRRL